MLVESYKRKQFCTSTTIFWSLTRGRFGKKLACVHCSVLALGIRSVTEGAEQQKLLVVERKESLKWVQVWENSTFMQIIFTVKNSICSGPAHLNLFYVVLERADSLGNCLKTEVPGFCVSIQILGMSLNSILTSAMKHHCSWWDSSGESFPRRNGIGIWSILGRTGTCALTSQTAEQAESWWQQWQPMP